MFSNGELLAIVVMRTVAVTCGAQLAVTSSRKPFLTLS